MSDDFFTVATRQRAHRRFSNVPLADAVVEQLLDVAVRAPSAENSQPWEFIVVRDPASRVAFGELMERAFDHGGREWSAQRMAPAVLAEVERGIRGGIARAPVLVVVCADTTRCAKPAIASSVFPAVQNLLLGATALGLGSALTTIALVYRDDVRKILALPEHVEPLAVVPIGHPPRSLGPSRREPAKEHTHRERYGMSW